MQDLNAIAKQTRQNPEGIKVQAGCGIIQIEDDKVAQG